ncbi:MAG: hypothetical protein KDA85_04225 [Planctomycetaceae bacterium]|nr:hypothetical protein [Planctomycetaceae bacterium]
MSSRVVTCTATEAAIETTVRLINPVDGQPLLTARQLTAVSRFSPRIEILVSFEEIRQGLSGNPWMTYVASRFAWDNESAAVTRSVLGQAAGFRAERFESPDYIEVADQDQRLLIIPHGRPYHRRSGPRMLDSLLLTEGETSRSFRFTLEFDQAWPQQSVQDLLLPPAALIPQTNAISPSTTSAWLLGLSARNVMLVSTADQNIRSELIMAGPSAPDAPSPSCSITLTLLETEMRACECLVRTARKPLRAWLLRSINGPAQELPANAEGVSVPFNSGQLLTLILQFR